MASPDLVQEQRTALCLLELASMSCCAPVNEPFHSRTAWLNRFSGIAAQLMATKAGGTRRMAMDETRETSLPTPLSPVRSTVASVRRHGAPDRARRA
jgi:hypothetical protein